MKRIRSTRTTMLLAALLTAGSVNANAPAGDGDELSLEALMNIKLQTGSFLELDLAKSPISMTTISRNKIQVSGARNLSEVLEIFVPGFQYAVNRWNGVVWGMRGVMNDRNSKFIVLVNGHKMNTEGRDGFIQETILPGLNEVERIEMLRGPAGLVYGSGAIAGIVNLVTRKADKSSNEVVATMGTWGSLSNTSRALEGIAFQAPDDKLKYTIYGAYGESDGQGYQKTKIYGSLGWPYPTWEKHDISNGVVSHGSANSMPPSWKIGGTLERDQLSLQARLTRQVSNVGGLMIADPWPWVFGQDSVASGTPKPATWYDGMPVPVSSNPYNQSDINSKMNKTREYVADNMMAEAVWTQPFGEDQLKLKVSLDANSNTVQVMDVPGAEVAKQPGYTPGFVQETMGERRITAGGTWLMKRIPQLQAAAGYEFRWDDIGDNMAGENYFTFYGSNTTKHSAVTPVAYTNHALFLEGMYDLRSDVSIGFGGRWDGHTRTMDDGGTLNGKMALIYQPVSGHSIKAIVQTSTNSATADNYEPNRYFIDDFGNPITVTQFQSGTTVHPQEWTALFSPVTSEQLHKVKPERTISYELTSTHQIALPKGLDLYVSPSASFNQVQDLLAWNQQLYQVQNTGEYNFVSLELEAELKSKYFEFGVSHVWQAPVNLDVADYTDTIDVPRIDASTRYYDSVRVNGVWQYYPIVAGYNRTPYNSIASTVSVDGDNFLNLHTNVSKASLTLTPVSWLALHADMRVFWGMLGRDSMVNSLEKAEGYGGGSVFNTLGIEDEAIVKLNAGGQLYLPGDWTFGVFAYNLLAGDTKSEGLLNSVRHQIKMDGSSNELYAIDNLSYAFKLQKTF